MLFSIVVIFIIIVSLISRNKEPRYSKIFRKYYGNTLDVKANEGMVDELAEKINHALKPDYMETVNTEFRMKYPHYSQFELNELWRELKRFFIMAAVFKSVEMFHDKVDELWHVMLEHEKEYKSFCIEYVGREIEHKPHSEKLFKPSERTFFDFCYVQLFKVDYVSMKVWGEFFQNGKGEDYLNSFFEWDKQRLRNEYLLLEASPVSIIAFDRIVEKVKDHKNEKLHDWQQKYKSSEDASFGYYAYAANDDDDRTFKEIMGIQSKGDHGHWDGGMNHHHYVHGGGGDHSSSSCSSCSSCSSGGE